MEDFPLNKFYTDCFYTNSNTLSSFERLFDAKLTCKSNTFHHNLPHTLNFVRCQFCKYTTSVAYTNETM